MTDFEDTPQEQEFSSRPNKTQLKREMKALQELGVQLVELPDDTLQSISMDAALYDAILLAKRITNNEGKRRQMQYIGKLMRKVDTEEIKTSLDNFNLEQQKNNQEFHVLEQWREKLVKDGKTALNKLLDEHQHLDRQHLWQLIRNSQKEAAENKPPASSRAIFKYLKEHISS